MNQGVQILLNRMDSHPDEFIPTLNGTYPHKWRMLLQKIDMRVKGGKDYDDQLQFLSDAEITALYNKMQSIRGDLFTKEVMATLLVDEDRNLAELSSFSGNSLSASKLKGRGTVTLSGYDYANISSITTIGNPRYP